MGQLEVGFLSNLRFPYEQKSQIRMDVLLGFFFFVICPKEMIISTKLEAEGI